MPDLTPAQVRDLLTATGLAPEDDDDLAEVTHRLNAIREALQDLDSMASEAEAPVTSFGPTDANP